MGKNKANSVGRAIHDAKMVSKTGGPPIDLLLIAALLSLGPSKASRKPLDPKSDASVPRKVVSSFYEQSRQHRHKHRRGNASMGGPV